MDFYLHILISIAHWLPTALGYNLVFGKGKILHFGPMGVSVAVAYAMFLTLMSTNGYFLALLAGTLMAVSLSLFFAWLSLRLEPDGMGVMSIAVHLSLLAVVLNWSSVTRGALGIPRISRMPFLESMPMITIVTCIVAGLFLVFYLWLDRSSFGRQLAALAEHDWHARSLGIRKSLIHALAFLILGMSHVSGVFFSVPYLHLLHPNDFQFPSLIFIVMIVVAGKPGSVWGVTISTALLVILKEGLRFVPLAPSLLGPVRLILFGVILLLAVWWRRDTLFPKARTV
jgi:branched-chain amino acid transport system permease protein